MASQDGTLSSTRLINSDTSFKTLTSSVANLFKSSECIRTAVGTPNTFRSTMTVFSSLTDLVYNSNVNTRDDDTKSEADKIETRHESHEDENIATVPEIIVDFTKKRTQRIRQPVFKKRKAIKMKKITEKNYNLSCSKLRNYRKAHVKIKKYVGKKMNAVDNNVVHIITGSMSEISHSRCIKKVLAKVNLLEDIQVMQNIPTEPDALIMSNCEMHSASTESEINHITLVCDSETKEKSCAQTSTTKANMHPKSSVLCHIPETRSPFKIEGMDLTSKCTPYRSDEKNLTVRGMYIKLTTKPSIDPDSKSNSNDLSGSQFTYTDSSGISTSVDKTWQGSNAMPSRNEINEIATNPADFSESNMEYRTFPAVKVTKSKLSLTVISDKTLPVKNNGNLAGSMLLTNEGSKYSCGLGSKKCDEKSYSHINFNILTVDKHKSDIPLTRDNNIIKTTDSNKLPKAKSLFQYATLVPPLSLEHTPDNHSFKTNSLVKFPSKIKSELNIPKPVKLVETLTVTKDVTQKPFLYTFNLKPSDHKSTRRTKRLCHPDVALDKSEVVLRVQDMSGSTFTKQSEPFSFKTNTPTELGNKSFPTTLEYEKDHPSDFDKSVREQVGEIPNYIIDKFAEQGMNQDSVNKNLVDKKKLNESVYNIDDDSKTVVLPNPLKKCSEEFKTVFPTTLTDLWDRLIYAIELAVAKAEESMSEKVIETVKKLHSNEGDNDNISKAMSRSADGDAPASSNSIDRSGLTPVQCLQCDLIDGQIIDHMVQIRNKVDALISDCLPKYSSDSLKMKDLKLAREIVHGTDTPKIVPRAGEGDVEQRPPESPSFELEHVQRSRCRGLRRVVRFIIENSLIITTVPTLLIFFLLMYSFIAFLIRM